MVGGLSGDPHRGEHLFPAVLLGLAQEPLRRDGLAVVGQDEAVVGLVAGPVGGVLLQQIEEVVEVELALLLVEEREGIASRARAISIIIL